MERPVTSRSRGICRYYKEPRGCFSGDKCKFLHGEPEQNEIKYTPYDQAKTCRYYAQGFCKRGDKCWFKHTAPKASTSKAEVEEEELCSICFDRPSTYGLLMGCTHVFCITCIKEWRDSARKNNQGGILKVTKLCPMCRAPSKYITPSSIFYKHDDPKKEQVVTAYKDSMARIPCRYFQRTKGDSSKKPLCPFGKDCFYQHLNADGTPFVFSDGVDVCMRRHPNRPTPPFTSGFSLHPFNYRNPLEMIEVLMSDQFGSIAAELTGALGNLQDHLDLELDEPQPTFRRSMLLRHNPPPRWPTHSHSPPRNHDHDDADMPGLEPINRPSSSQSNESDDSMPMLQDVSESEDEDSQGNSSDSNDDEEDRTSAARPTGPFRHRLDPVEAAIREEILDVLAFADGVAGEAQTQEEVRAGDGNTRPPFVTDGRGRVIGTRGEEGEADAENQRSVLGRMFDAFF